jgi:hypothetical protein
LVVAPIAVIALIIGGIGVMNIMLVSVTERTREIGVRTAVGARRGDILRQFLIEAVIVCLIGGMLGLALAFVVSLIFSRIFTDFPMIFSEILHRGRRRGLHGHRRRIRFYTGAQCRALRSSGSPGEGANELCAWHIHQLWHRYINSGRWRKEARIISGANAPVKR